MDDGTQVSKYLLEPAFLRELYLFELATTIALMRENVSLTHAADFTTTSEVNNSNIGGEMTTTNNQETSSYD